MWSFFSFKYFFSIWVFLHEHSRLIGQQGKGEPISLSPLYHFHPLHRHLDISRGITAETSPLHIASSCTGIGNLWFPTASCSSLSYALSWKTHMQENFRFLFFRIFKILNRENLQFVWGMFTSKFTWYFLWSCYTLDLLPRKALKGLGFNSLSIRGFCICCGIPSPVKFIEATNVFKRKIKSWLGVNCIYHICSWLSLRLPSYISHYSS